MTFDLLDHVIKVTFKQSTENNAMVYVLLSPVKVPRIAPLTVIYMIYRFSLMFQLLFRLKINIKRGHTE